MRPDEVGPLTFCLVVTVLTLGAVVLWGAASVWTWVVFAGSANLALPLAGWARARSLRRNRRYGALRRVGESEAR